MTSTPAAAKSLMPASGRLGLQAITLLFVACAALCTFTGGLLYSQYRDDEASRHAELMNLSSSVLRSTQLTASTGSASSDLGQLFAAGQGAWTFMPSINLPIFNWGRNQSNLDAAKVQTSIEVANYQKAIQVAFREVSDALIARDSFNKQVTAENLLVQANARSYRLAKSRYQEGVDTFLDSLDAQRSLYSAQQTLVTTKLSRINNLVSLYKALGGGEVVGSRSL